MAMKLSVAGVAQTLVAERECFGGRARSVPNVFQRHRLRVVLAKQSLADPDRRYQHAPLGTWFEKQRGDTREPLSDV